MPQAIGAAIFALGGTAGVAAGATAIAGTTAAALVGSAVLTGGLLGAQLLLAPKPDIPKPQDGSIVLKQSIPPAIYAYGRCRNAGAYLAYELKGSTSYDVIAFHQGRIDGYENWYLHDDLVEFETGDDGWVKGQADGKYGGNDANEREIRIYWRKGETPETAYAEMIEAFPDKWGPNYRGDGIATAELICMMPSTKYYPKRYPFGLPQLSVVGRWQLCWDPRDEGQSPDDDSTWTWTTNPVRQLLHFYCHCPAGYRRKVARVYEPVADYWLAAIDLCDDPVQRADGTFEPRYAAGGRFDSETPRKSVVEALLRSFDGWIAERGDGAIVVYGGWHYGAPSVVVEDRHIYDIRLKKGRLADERITKLTLKVSSPDHDYNDVDLDPWVNQAEIDAGAQVIARPAQAEWCQSWTQMRRLGKIEFEKARCKLRGTLRLNQFGENLRGRRFFTLNSREQMSTRMVLCEVLDFHDNSFGDGSYEIEFQSVDPEARYGWNPATDEGRRPAVPAKTGDDELPIPPLPTVQVVRQAVSGGGTIAVISATSPPVEGWSDLTLEGHYRQGAAGSWQPMTPSDDGDLQVFSGPVTDGELPGPDPLCGGGGGSGDYSVTATITVIGDDAAPAAPEIFVTVSTGVSFAATASNSANVRTIEVRRGTAAQPFAAATVIRTLNVSPNQTISGADDPGPGTWRYWAENANASGVASGAPDHMDVTVV